ncbi:hypothetical protein pmac_cds_627 [Pandoravirus macleodensis]|uniref:Uncharacterized protein n=1 Tax=Pandoravirus macleodensis TaxID=2107707 RepID=A0A2U7UG03_9VIRU|nr:hypothetical protein pmac_cds_627 [Pandoravirus macleodensis]AVK77315.1 hypothetical protein pmac_cds_627 [Pandoravirus macleodensis]
MMIRVSSVMVARVRACGRMNRDDTRRRDSDGKSRVLAQALTRVVVETVHTRLVVGPTRNWGDGDGDNDGDDDIDRDSDGDLSSDALERDKHSVFNRERCGGDAMGGGHARQRLHQSDVLVAASIDALDAYLGTPEARALCPVTSCLCGRNFETFVRDIVYDILGRDAPSTP